MSSYNSISAEKLSRLIGTPQCPALIDVRTDDDFAADPRFIPGASRYSYEHVREWAAAFADRPAIVVCHRGKKLSEGVAAWLRQDGGEAESLEGGVEAWAQANFPMVPEASIPPRDAEGRTLWVTRSRPKVDRIACPWL